MNVDFFQFADLAHQGIIISQKIWEFIQTPFPQEACFYTLRKTHKNLLDPLVVLLSRAMAASLKTLAVMSTRFYTTMP